MSTWRTLQLAVNEIFRLWANNYRFASEHAPPLSLEADDGLPENQG